MAGGIGGSGVGTVGDQGIIAAGGDHRIVLQFFHGQKIIVFPVGQTLGQDPGDFPGLEAHAVPHEQDHVLGPFGRLFADHGITGGGNPFAGPVLGGDLHFISTGLGEGDLVSPVGSDPVAQILLHQFLPEEFVRRLAVDGDGHVLQLLVPFHFHIEVKFGSGPEFGPVHRQDADFRRFHRGQQAQEGTSQHR